MKKACKGIIEKYKKVSSLFAGCQIKAESKLGEGALIATLGLRK